MPIVDTKRGRDLTRTLIADIVLQLRSYVAQTGREFIRQRQIEGIAAAKARGLHMGRYSMEKLPRYTEILSLWQTCKNSGQQAPTIMALITERFAVEVGSHPMRNLLLWSPEGKFGCHKLKIC